MSNTINARIVKVNDLLSQNLEIPTYQRPYRWTEENVRQLLEDIYESWKQGKKLYRVGSVILHLDAENKYKLNIVDGQQRITTLLLILKDVGSDVGLALRQKKQYNNTDSQRAIRHNKKFIERWFAENLQNEKSDFSKYLTDYCEFVEIVVSDMSEAFQMFDSQNGKGKELEAYNLLKAYHIRAMEGNSFSEKVDCDRNWENATRFTRDIHNPKDQNFDLLKQIFSEQLFRSRVWSRKEIAEYFGKNKISEFKGITIGKQHEPSFPFQNKELLHNVVQNYFDTLGVDVKGIRSRFKNKSPNNVNPFSLINQNIINGKDFFTYIETYVEIYKQIFENSEDSFMKEFKEFYVKNCLHYEGSYRDGDRYLRELYKSLIFLFFDRFGEEGVLKFFEILYMVVYRLRLEKIQVKYAPVAEYPTTYKLFYIIDNAKSYSDLQNLERLAFKKIEVRKNVKSVINIFKEKGVEMFSNDENIKHLIA